MDSNLPLCIVDRFEGDWAVIEFDGTKIFQLPRTLLPKDISEGDVLQIEVTKDSQETEKRRKEIENMTRNMFVEE